MPRAAVHGANAGAFVAGSLQAHAALPARVALLRRLVPRPALHPAEVAVADAPIVVIEIVGITVVVAVAAGRLWARLGAVAVLAILRAAAGRRATRGLAVLADVRRRAAIAALVACVVCCGLARVWLALAAAHLDASPPVAVAFGACGIFGRLPLGPSGPPGALVVAAGGASALAAGWR
jgi:hypothetical protein